MEISDRTLEIFEQIPYPVVIHYNGEIIMANTATAELSAVSCKEKLIGVNVLGFLTDAYKEKAVAFMKQEKEYEHELFEMVDKKGIHKDIEIKKSYFEEKGQRYAFLMIKDVTVYRRGLLRAAKIQRASMSTELNGIDGIIFDSGFCPREIVSGDFYYHEISSENIVLGILGDVKGKGLSAALSTSAMKILFYEAGAASISTKAMVNRINQGMMRLMGEEYVAAIIFRIDLKKQIVSVTGAGISEFLYRPVDGDVNVEMLKGPFLGMFEEDMFENRHYSFAPGTEIIFYSDGLELAGIADHLRTLEVTDHFIDRMKMMEDVCKKDVDDDRTWVAFQAL